MQELNNIFLLIQELNNRFLPTQEWIEVQELTETSRGEGGFGSTGVK